MLSRIDAAAASAAPDVIARRKEMIESEFRLQSAGLLRRVVRENWGLFLDGVGLGTLACVMALFVQRLLTGDLAVSAFLPKALSGQEASYLLWATAIVFVAGGLWFGLRQRVRLLMP